MIYLYVKKHLFTGLLYFGKTTQNPFKYRGSGTYWKRHIKKYGNFVTTEIVFSSESIEECEKFALKFSEENDIVKSPLWANLMVENGKDGAPLGHEGYLFSEDQKKHFSEVMKLAWKDENKRNNMLSNRVFDDKRKSQVSESTKKAWESRPERRIEQAERAREFSKTADKTTGFYKYVVGKRSEKHKEGISKSLKGAPKSEEHKEAVAYAKFSAETKNIFETVTDLRNAVLLLVGYGVNKKDIAECFNISLSMVYDILKRSRDGSK